MEGNACSGSRDSKADRQYIGKTYDIYDNKRYCPNQATPIHAKTRESKDSRIQADLRLAG